MRKTHMMLKKRPLATCALLIAASRSAHAALSITNGDFETNAPGSNVADVDSWFDAAENGQTDGTWFFSTWPSPGIPWVRAMDFNSLPSPGWWEPSG